MEYDKYTIRHKAKLIEALIKIDANKKGFLIAIDDNGCAVGTLTDGDVRRVLIKGKTLCDSIECAYQHEFKRLENTDNIGKAIELFKNESIKFLPVVDSKNVLMNIITKKQLHALLLQDMSVDLLFDFWSIDENIVDYEIFQRPWGFYKTTVMNNYFQSKIISVNPKAELSLQSHNHREEYWIVAHGQGIVQIEQSRIEIKCGSSIFIPKGAKHRLINTCEKESLIVTEVQIGDYFGEDDICRYEDIYGRD